MLLAVWCLLSLVAVAMGADEPRKCCFDKEFSVVLGEAGGTVNHGQASSLDVSQPKYTLGSPSL